MPYPYNHTPRNMKPEDISLNEFPDMTNVYCYNFRDDPPPVGTHAGSSSEKEASVKHIFTGPFEHLKIHATGLFYQIQEGVELAWQSVSAGIAEGISTHLHPPFLPDRLSLHGACFV